MIDYEIFSKINHLKEREGLTVPQIASQLALDQRTVRKWAAEPFRPRATPHRASKLDPFKHDIIRMLETYPYSAAQILQRIR
jgi:transposase